MAVKRIPIQSGATTANLFAVMASKPRYNRKEAAQLAGVGLRTRNRLVTDEQFSARRIRRHFPITRKALSQFMERDHQTAVIL
jgi:excisionase family DNA binding protein